MYSSSDKPWNEQQWERFIKRSEARSARFGELLETLGDRPDGERLVAQEMGWDHIVEAIDRADLEQFDLDPADSDDQTDDVRTNDDLSLHGTETSANVEAHDQRTANDREPIDDDEELDDLREVSQEDREAKKRLYRLARDVGMEVHRALKPLTEQIDIDDPDEAGEQLQSACINSHIPAAKIAGAHGLGYDEDVLCGHIVTLRRGLEAINTCAEAFDWLKQRGVMPSDELSRVRARVTEVAVALEQRIVELRSRVWWD